MTVRYSDEEWTTLCAAATSEQRTVTGYVGDAALAAAQGATSRGPGSTRERFRLLGVEMMVARTALNLACEALTAAGGTGDRLSGTAEACAQAVVNLDEVTSALRQRLAALDRTADPE